MISKDFPFQDYIGRPVGDLLKALPPYDRFIYIDNGRPGILGGANFLFGEKWLKVRVGDSLEHLSRFNERYAWDFGLFQQEKLREVSW